MAPPSRVTAAGSTTRVSSSHNAGFQQLVEPDSLIKGDASNPYLGQPDTEEGLVKLCLALPSIGRGQLDFDDRGTCMVLNQIRKGCKVWIQVRKTEANAMLVIQSREKKCIHDAINKVRNLVNSSQAIWHPCYLIRPPASSREGMMIKLDTTTKDGARFIFPRSAAEGTTLDESSTPAEQGAYATKFRQSFAKVEELMRDVPNEMRMRVHLGKLVLSQWRRGKEDLTYAEFQKLTNDVGKRGCAWLDQRLGDEEFADLVLQKVLGSDDLFDPATTDVSRLPDTTPKKHLVLFTKGFRIEIEVQQVHSSTSHSSSTAANRQVTLSSIRAFQEEQGNSRIEITTVCPDSYYDWKLEVLKESGRAALPPVIQGIRNQIRLGDATDDDGFPTPVLSRALVATGIITRVSGKTSWTVISKNSPYYMEISLYRDWCDVNTSVAPMKSCGVTFYGLGWDDETRYRNITVQPRYFGADGYNLLDCANPDSPDFGAFLAQVQQYQTFLDGAREFYGAIKGDSEEEENETVANVPVGVPTLAQAGALSVAKSPPGHLLD